MKLDCLQIDVDLKVLTWLWTRLLLVKRSKRLSSFLLSGSFITGSRSTTWKIPYSHPSVKKSTIVAVNSSGLCRYTGWPPTNSTTVAPAKSPNLFESLPPA